MRTSVFITFLIIIFLTIGCNSKEKKSIIKDIGFRVQQIDTLFQRKFKEDKFHGGVVISKKGEILYENYFGIADRSLNILMRRNMKFDIASVNKSMIAGLVLKAVENKLLNLEDKLVDLLSDFKYSGQFDSEITLHQMLCHRSGLPDYDSVSLELKENGFLKFKRLRFTNEEYVDFISQLKSVSKPNQKFYYSNFAYHLIAMVLETVYNKSFKEVLKENLTTPLGLKYTVSESENENIIPGLVKAYTYDFQHNKWKITPYIDLSLGRRIFSTPSDLNKWAQVIGNPGWLSQSSLKLMLQNYQENTSNISYGYGWFVVDEEHKSKIGNLEITQPYIIHGGSTDGYKAMLININNQEFVISFLSNVGNRTNEMKLAQEIVKILIQ